jgi:hypothetical protein
MEETIRSFPRMIQTQHYEPGVGYWKKIPEQTLAGEKESREF